MSEINDDPIATHVTLNRQRVLETSIFVQFRFRKRCEGIKKKVFAIGYNHEQELINGSINTQPRFYFIEKRIFPSRNLKGRIPALNGRNCSKAVGARGIISRPTHVKPTRTKR